MAFHTEKVFLKKATPKSSVKIFFPVVIQIQPLETNTVISYVYLYNHEFSK